MQHFCTNKALTNSYTATPL